VIDVGALGMGQHETWTELMALAEPDLGQRVWRFHASAAAVTPGDHIEERL